VNLSAVTGTGAVNAFFFPVVFSVKVISSIAHPPTVRVSTSVEHASDVDGKRMAHPGTL
jgi:hypothetical protein